MQVVVIFGGALVMWMRAPMVMLLLLIGLKIFIDLRLHEKERHSFSPAHMLQA